MSAKTNEQPAVELATLQQTTVHIRADLEKFIAEVKPHMSFIAGAKWVSAAIALMALIGLLKLTYSWGATDTKSDGQTAAIVRLETTIGELRGELKKAKDDMRDYQFTMLQMIYERSDKKVHGAVVKDVEGEFHVLTGDELTIKTKDGDVKCYLTPSTIFKVDGVKTTKTDFTTKSLDGYRHVQAQIMNDMVMEIDFTKKPK